MKYQLLLFCLLITSLISRGQLSGVVFRDYDGDGTQDASTGYNEPGVRGMQVKIFNASDVQVSTVKITDASGAFNFSAAEVSAGTALRVEFSFPASAIRTLDQTIDYASFNGGGHNGTSVQFVTAGAGAVAHFGINNPADYLASLNPTVMAPVFRNGDPLSNTSGGINSYDSSVLISFPYANSGTSPKPSVVSIGRRIGSVWGLGYSRQSNSLFASAMVKRHVGLGPAGGTPVNAPGAIYLIRPGVDQGNFFFSLDALSNTFWTHDHTAGNAMNVRPNGTGAGQRGLPADMWTRVRDASAFDQVGKTGLGGLELSDDGRFIYTINLYTRQLIKIDLQDPLNPQVPANTQVSAYAMPSVTCSASGVLRPWAVKFYRGKVYIGAVCSGEGTTTPADNSGTTLINESADAITAYVFEFDPATSIFSTILSQTLNYVRSSPNWNGGPPGGCYARRGWYHWVNTFQSICSASTNVWPSPIFADIEFDVDGSLILSFMDRNGHQAGVNQLRPTASGFFDTYVNGELLRAYLRTDDTYEFESAGKEGASSPKPATAGATNGEGPGGGEFYYGDGNILHPDNVCGGMGLLPGSGEVLTAFIDPINAGTNGSGKLSNTTGAFVSGYECYNITDNVGIQSKSNGLGDLQLLGSLAPLEIGNRIWEDVNGNGIQDAGEPGFAGITMELYDASGTTLLATTSSNANGYWYFNYTNVPDGSVLPGIQPGLQTNTNYIIRIAAAQYSGQGLGPLLGYILTRRNITGNGLPDFSDNDFSHNASMLAELSVTTGSYGQNNHTFDAGLATPSVLDTELGELQAVKQVNTVALYWNTLYENKVAKFVVQHATQQGRAVIWTNTGTVLLKQIPTGTAYEFKHEKPLISGTNYYRIAMEYQNGVIKYSNIQTVKFDQPGGFMIYPNPANNFATLSLPLSLKGRYAEISIHTITGKLLYTKSASYNGGNIIIPSGHLPNGSYVVTVSAGYYKETKKLQVQH
jgi:hypothetical protein